MGLINRNCFLRMYGAGGYEELPTATMREKDMCVPVLIFVPTESYQFYFPTDALISDFDFEAPGVSYPVIGDRVEVVTPIGTHQIISFDFPEGIPDGQYEINMGAYRSNVVEVINNPAEANEISMFIRYSHNKPIDKIYYPYVGSSFKQRIRIRLSAGERRPEVERTSYRTTNTGKFKNLRGQMSEYIIFQTLDYLTEDHLACRLLSEHDDVLINDKQFTIRESNHYDYTPNQDIPVSTGTFGMYDDAATSLFRC